MYSQSEVRVIEGGARGKEGIALSGITNWLAVRHVKCMLPALRFVHAVAVTATYYRPISGGCANLSGVSFSPRSAKVITVATGIDARIGELLLPRSTTLIVADYLDLHQRRSSL